MEVFLCMEGFGDVYEATISEQKRNHIKAEKGTLEYWEQVIGTQQGNYKSRNSLTVAEKIVAEGRGRVPKLLAEVVKQARKLARSAG